MGGLWYEYLYTDGFRGSQNYECATMNLLLGGNNETSFTEYEVLHHAMNKTSNETGFEYKKLTCGAENTTEALNCKYENSQLSSFLHRWTVNKPMNLQIVATDQHSYLLASVCQEFGLFHYQDYLVMSREKEPSLLTRKRMLDGLRESANFKDEEI